VVCVGGRPRPTLRRAITFRATEQELDIDELLKGKERVAFVVPPSGTWPLPIYELALMSRRRAQELGMRELALTVVTPETAPLIIFGTVASEAVAGLLAARGIEVETATRAHESEDGELILSPGDRRLDAEAILALPEMVGPEIPGLPADDRGFIPIDENARVKGVDDVYAAGDGTTFPIKQGGLGTQQADAAAEQMAARFGAPIDPRPFHPILRGQLLTGEESLHLQQDVAGGAGEGTASLDYLWWPPHKVGGRYLSPWLEGLSRLHASTAFDRRRDRPSQGMASRAHGTRSLRSAGGGVTRRQFARHQTPRKALSASIRPAPPSSPSGPCQSPPVIARGSNSAITRASMAPAAKANEIASNPRTVWTSA
jgi:sulfide:quinone oxidoreductase